MLWSIVLICFRAVFVFVYIWFSCCVFISSRSFTHSLISLVCRLWQSVYFIDCLCVDRHLYVRNGFSDKRLWTIDVSEQKQNLFVLECWFVANLTPAQVFCFWIWLFFRPNRRLRNTYSIGVNIVRFWWIHGYRSIHKAIWYRWIISSII